MERIYVNDQVENKKLDRSIEEILREYEKDSGAMIHGYVFHLGDLCIPTTKPVNMLGESFELYDKYLQILSDNIEGIEDLTIEDISTGRVYNSAIVREMKNINIKPCID